MVSRETKRIKPPGLESSIVSNGNEHREAGLNMHLETRVIYYTKGIFGDYKPMAES